MAPYLLPFALDAIKPAATTAVTITVDGEPVSGVAGQSLAGVILASGTLGFRRSSASGRPRGVFCGIGICYDCLVEVNGQRDVRACQRRASEGDAVTTQYDRLPKPDPAIEPASVEPTSVIEPVEIPGAAGLDELDHRCEGPRRG